LLLLKRGVEFLVFIGLGSDLDGVSRSGRHGHGEAGQRPSPDPGANPSGRPAGGISVNSARWSWGFACRYRWF